MNLVGVKFLPYGVIIRSSFIDRLELDRFIDTEEASNASAIILRFSALDTLTPNVLEFTLSCCKLLLLNTVPILCASLRGVDILSRVSKISLAVELITLASVDCIVLLFADAEASEDDGRE